LIAMKIDIKWMTGVIVIILFITGFNTRSVAQDKFEKADFYQAMGTDNITVIDSEITTVQNSSSKNKEGYEGALLLKKAGLVVLVTKKLKYFKAGKIKLETAILNDPDNTEYHFLRLTVEEHAPKIVNYYSDIDTDKMIIQKNYKNLSPVVQHAILDYCKKSKVLRAEDL